MQLRIDLARCWLITKADRARMALVWRLPHWLVYWATIRACANATTGQFGSEEAPAVTLDKILGRWERRQGGDPSFS